jgi:hypothetical protein
MRDVSSCANFAPIFLYERPSAKNIEYKISTGGESVMKSAKILAIVACACLLSVTMMYSARHAYAQDDDQVDEDAGSWSTPGGGSADEESSPDMKKPPLDVQGCWDGTAIDNNPTLGMGTVIFESLEQDGKKLEKTSNFDFRFAGGSYNALGHLTGAVSSTGFTFKGSAGKGCPISGSATGDDTSMTGKFKFGKKCKHDFDSGTFAIFNPCT